MTIPGETVTVAMRVRDVAAGDAAVPGLTLAAFTVLAFDAAGAITLGDLALAEQGDGIYLLSYTQPAATAGQISVFLDPGIATYYVEWPHLYAEVESNDLDSVTAAARLQTAIVRADGAPAAELSITRVAGDTYDLVFQVVDANGDAIALSAYNTHRVGIRSEDGAINVQYSGAAVVASGNTVTVTVAAGDAWQAAMGGIYRIDHDCVKTATSKIHTLARGTLEVLRHEAGVA